VQADTIRYTPDGVSMLLLALRDSKDRELVRWELEEISDTIFYQIPCNNNDIAHLNIVCSLPSGVSGSFSAWADAVAGGAAGAGEITPTAQSDSTLQLNVRHAGLRVITVTLNAAGNKRYTLVLNKNFNLFDVINEHLGALRVVNINPATNHTELIFSACTWWHKRDSGLWHVGEEKLLYYSAGTNIRDKFTEKDSMYLVLTLPNGSLLETCPDANHIVAGDGDENGSDGEGIGSAGTKVTDMAIYPNPVPSGGHIKIKHTDLTDDEDENNHYEQYFLYDTQGHLIFTGDALPLYEGQDLTMPQTPGIYHLLLEGKNGKRWTVKIAVGE
jgi:hypothetical protein